MEKTSRAAVVPVACGWSDVGSWHAVWELSDKDVDGNAARGWPAPIWWSRLDVSS
jgi:mannose-1-phosphate guanylyltransferase/mannose-6-phosphate isomerase